MRQLRNKYSFLNSESGFTLMEVAFAGAIMVIIGLAYLGTISQSISISQIYLEQNKANLLIEQEIEVLRNTPFDQIPFRQSSEAKKLIEVPDYYEDIAIGESDPTKPGFVGSTGDLDEFDKLYAFDGLRAGEKGWNRWIASVNGPLVTGGFVPQTDDPVIVVDPDDPDNDIIINPSDSDIIQDITAESQFVYVAFPKKIRIHRVLYDNRFNTRGDETLPSDHIDYRNRRENIWQRDFHIFISEDEEILPGLPFRPEFNSSEIIYEAQGRGYGSTGLIEVYNNIDEPLEVTVLGVANISVETNFDSLFNYPYVSELECYGFKEATNFVGSYTFPDGETHLGNYIMFMPRYNESSFDMFRRVYVLKEESDFPPGIDRQQIFRIHLKVYPHNEGRNTDQFVREQWWQDDDSELMEFTFTFARAGEIVFDDLPGLQDLPKHTYYYNNEDILIPYTVPGANEIRAHFSTFDLQNYPETDFVQFLDKNGNLYGNEQYYGNQITAFSLGPYSPWVSGDTLLIRFVSDDYISSIPNGNLGGFEVDFVEIK